MEEKEIYVRAKEVCGLGWCALWLFIMMICMWNMDENINKLSKSVVNLVKSHNRMTVALENAIKDVNDLFVEGERK